jgi:hypothetical protein
MVQPLDGGPSPFHPGEQKVQSLVGAREVSEALGRSWHKRSIPHPIASIFLRQSLLFIATRSDASSHDSDGLHLIGHVIYALLWNIGGDVDPAIWILCVQNSTTYCEATFTEKAG